MNREDTVTEASPLLAVEGLALGYDGPDVVRGIDLQVAAGEIVCLLGPNGAGKTTSLLALSGLLRTREGVVRFDGAPLAKVPAHEITRRGLVQVPEDRSLFGSLTVAENLATASRDSADIERVLGYFPKLRDLSGRRASVLSGGEQQMLAVARALLLNPKLLVIDEMSLGLAPLIVAEIFGILRQIVADTDCSVLLVEQHVQLALDFADRAYVMSRGRIVDQGTASDILSRLPEIQASYFG